VALRPRDPRADVEVRRFSAALGRLDVETFAALVADVWEARGRPTTRRGTRVTVDAEDGRRARRLRVTHGRPAEAGGGAAADGATTVVTSRATSDREAADAAGRVVDATELLRTVRYAVERDRAASILERYLGEEGAKFVSPGVVRAERERSRARRRRLARRVAAASLLAACVAGVVVVGPALAPVVDGRGLGSAVDGAAFDPTPSATSAERVVASTDRPRPTPESVDDGVDYAALGCPVPPADAHPAALRPAVIPGASSNGLDGWRLVETANASYEGGFVRVGTHGPRARHAATYASPSGGTFEVDIDRWRSVPAASDAAAALADRDRVALLWGRYTVTVAAFDENGTRLSASRTLVRSRVLLAEVRDPSGTRLGARCVGALLVGGGSAERTVVA
jgi:hypothetical protein